MLDATARCRSIGEPHFDRAAGDVLHSASDAQLTDDVSWQTLPTRCEVVQRTAKAGTAAAALAGRARSRPSPQQPEPSTASGISRAPRARIMAVGGQGVQPWAVEPSRTERQDASEGPPSAHWLDANFRRGARARGRKARTGLRRYLPSHDGNVLHTPSPVKSKRQEPGLVPVQRKGEAPTSVISAAASAGVLSTNAQPAS